MITIDNQKQCNKCKEWKPATNEFFSRSKSCALGLDARCKQCKSANNRKRYEENSEKVKEKNRKWRSENPKRAKELARKRYEANPEREKERKRKWKEANQWREKETNRKWREANLERHKELSRKWKEANPDKTAANNHKRRARKSNADGTATAEQIKARFQYHENRCYYCGDSESGLHIEHRIPLSRGGSNWPANLVPSCPTCNLSKHAKTEKEFINQ